jgi:Ala-tRNA(Pro) deacylase
MIGSDSDSILRHLSSIGLAYQLESHEPMLTMADVRSTLRSLEGGECKNLFLCDRKKRVYFLLVTSPWSRVNLAALGQRLGVGRLGLASDTDLLSMLGVASGSVSFLALFNDSERKVRLLIDSELWLHNERLLAHPLVNTMTVSVTRDEAIAFFASCQISWHLVNIGQEGGEESGEESGAEPESSSLYS